MNKLIILYKIIYTLYYYFLIIIERTTYYIYLFLVRYNRKIQNLAIDIHLKILTGDYINE